jgi:hypothetical protein
MLWNGWMIILPPSPPTSNKLTPTRCCATRRCWDFRQLRAKVETCTSIPTIFYLQNQAAELMDAAQDMIQKAHEEQLKAAKSPALTGP